MNESQRGFVGIEMQEVLGDGDLITWKDELGPDVGKWLEDKAARSKAGVGEFEQAAGFGGFAEVENIQIDDSWGVSFCSGTAAKVEFDGLSGIEEFVRRAGVADLDDGVVEVRGVFGTGDWSRLIDGRLEDVSARCADFFQELPCGPEVLQAIAEIGTEGDGGTFGHRWVGKARYFKSRTSCMS